MNIKKIAASFLAAAMVISSLAIGSFAANIGVAEGTLDEETGLLYVPLDDGTLKVTYPDGVTLEGDIVIPETFGEGDEEKTVTQIHYNLIFSPQNMTSLSIPKTITNISREEKCVSSSRLELASITVDEDNPVFSSEDGVLFNKDKTEIIKYPSKKLRTEYIIPSTVVTIGDACFAGCELQSVTIPVSVKTIGFHAFWDCWELSQLNILDSVSYINSGIIEGSGVTEITVDPGNTDYCVIDGVLFTTDKKTLVAYPIANGLEEYYIPNGTEILLHSAFSGNKTIKNVIIPDSITTIDAYTFGWCSNLTTVEIPSKVTEIRGTFMGCFKLEAVTLPLSLTNIGSQTFNGCSSLKTVNYAGTQADWDKIRIGTDNEAINNATIYFSDGTTGGTEITDVVQKPAVTEKEDGTKDFTPGVKKNATTSDSDIETMKSITANAPAEAFDEGVVLNVSHDTFSGSGNSFAVDISFVNSETNEKVQPKEGTSVTVKIPVPENLKNSDPLFMYHINDNGKAEKVEAETETIAGVKYMVFKATHFSTYVLSDNPNAADDTAGGNTSGSTGGNTGGTTSTPSTPADTTPSAPSTSTSTPAASDTTSGESTSSETMSSEPVSSDNTTSSVPSTSDSNPTTGVAMSALPLLAAVSAVIVIKNKK